MLHGFMGNSDVFEECVHHLKSFCNPIALDLMGHGQTEGAELHYQFDVKQQIAQLNAVFSSFFSEPFFLHGYSMGGRLALQVAAKGSPLIKGLILESTTFGIERESERQARQALDAEKADAIMGDFPQFVEAWQKNELFTGSSSERIRQIQLAQNPLWIANSLLGFGTGTMPCIIDKLPGIRKPVCLIAGKNDSKFVHIHHKMNSLLPKSEMNVIPGCGHRVHFDKPEQFAEIIHAFILNNSTS